MVMDRRQFLQTAALAAGGAMLPAAGAAQAIDPKALAADWTAVRELFPLSSDAIHMSAMLIASHPRPVAAAIARYRDALDADPVTFLQQNDDRLTDSVLAEAGRYLAVDRRAIALTDSTTQGVGIVYAGLRLKPRQEIVTTAQDYYVTHESLRLAAIKTGGIIRRVSIYDDAARATTGSLIGPLLKAINPRTRLVALTWVHSSTGIKLPIAQIAAAIAEINRQREPGQEVLLGVDGVHGFGVEDVTFADLGCDFLMAGCHKWLFGPRGTGVVIATERGWQASEPTIPTFLDSGVFTAWLRHEPPDKVSDGATMTPGGFKAFEHRWALAEAFRLHLDIGKDRVMARTHELAGQLKAGLARMPHVRLVTPMSPALSAGIVSFDVAGYSAEGAVRALRARRIIASAAPYATPHVRLTPSIRNTPAEIEAALRAVAELE